MKRERPEALHRFANLPPPGKMTSGAGKALARTRARKKSRTAHIEHARSVGCGVKLFGGAHQSAGRARWAAARVGQFPE